MYADPIHDLMFVERHAARGRARLGLDFQFAGGFTTPGRAHKALALVDAFAEFVEILGRKNLRVAV